MDPSADVRSYLLGKSETLIRSAASIEGSAEVLGRSIRLLEVELSRCLLDAHAREDGSLQRLERTIEEGRRVMRRLTEAAAGMEDLAVRVRSVPVRDASPE